MPAHPCRRLFLLCCLVLPVSACAARADLRAEFGEALAQAERGEPVQAHAALRRYVLYPYLEAVQLSARLPQADAALDRDMAAYHTRHAHLPVARQLHQDWLRSLAARGQWAALLEHAAPEGLPVDLVCHQLNARAQAGGDEGLVEAALQVWMTGALLPESCVAPFDWLQAQGALTPERLAARIELALVADSGELADFLLRQLPQSEGAALRWHRRLQTAPQDSLEQLRRQPRTPVDFAAIEDGWFRLARRQPQAAAEQLDAFIRARKLADEPAARLRELTGLGLAWSRLPGAVRQFRAAGLATRDERVHEWRVRSALWHGEWTQALQWIEALPPALADSARWRYWRARALEALEQREEAQRLYAELSHANNAYAALASWRLGQPARPVPAPAPAPVPALQRSLDRLPGLVRGIELHALGRAEWLNQEWAVVLNALPPEQLPQLAHWAMARGWRLHGVLAASRAAIYDDYALLYPRPYDAQVRAAAVQSRVRDDFIYAVMRQESLFDPRAVSPANARGLMQLLPATAERTARRWKLPVPDLDALFEPETNIRLGAAYLRDMTERFGDQPLLTLAAYNAGPNAAARWLPDAPMDPDVWMENIPYNETRDYVQRILWHIAVFGFVEQGEPQDLGEFLRPVARP
ncbi:MAG: transglycosylase SLT domain-containing protein [Gammaproteobacteria bacterium]